MSSFLRYSIMAVAFLVILACIFTSCQPEPAPVDPSILDQPSVLALTVQPQSTTLPAVGQAVSYNFVVTNNGSAALTGPLTITDNKMTVTCPELNTVGNLNGNLDPGESITCTGSYTVTQADFNACTVSDVATATIGGVSSTTVTTTLRCPAVNVLGLTITANPTSYAATGTTAITYTYTVTNTGTAALTGPFSVTITGNPVPITCGTAATILAQNQTVTCTSVYTTTATDLQAPQITHAATATGPGGATSQQATATVLRSGTPSPGGNPNIPRGTNFDHTVENGEWLLQISRCYGADYNAVVRANPTIRDPHWIYPGNIVRVPNVGSNGFPYGKPCIEIYTVVSGDTWQSIANAKDADLEVFMEANRNVSLTPGNKVKVPLHSRQSGVPSTPPTPTVPPTRLTFTDAAPTVTQNGTANAGTNIRYVFSGSAGQVLTVQLTVATNDINLAIYGPNNAVVKAADATRSWTGTLTATGDHIIELVPQAGATGRAYTLQVTLNSAPPPPQPVERVADIYAGAGSSNPSHLAIFNGGLYFQANANDGVGAELWKYDRGLSAISRVADIMVGEGGSEPAFLTPYGEMLYFRANGNDGAGVELWRLNGTGSWGRVGDLLPGTGDSNPMYMTVFNNALYFSANGGDGFGVELWRYDGTTTTRVTDINPNAGDSSPAYLEVFNNALYFSATSNDGSGTELWRHDGTATTRVDDINEGVGNSNPAFLTVFNNALYFSADGNDGAGTELWRFDGTSVARAADINVGAAPSIPTYLAVFGNALYFSANGDASGFELWKFDGTTASRVADINNAGNSNPAYLTVYNNELYFQATGNDNTGAELWKFRGP